MAQYQTFPGAEGASRTFEKLKALMLPDLERRSFLDVGCNEGFFCGFAVFSGASRAVGIDQSSLFIERARTRFPDCEFLLQSWDSLPEGKFDVILLASALHYADDQPALVHKLVEKLSDNGSLVLEIGVATAAESAWIEVERGIDKRFFPSMAKVREMLADYAWKWVGPSVMQQGDPVPRHVFHVSRRKPVAYLLMQPPGYGKSSIATRLFSTTGVPVVSGDHVISLVAEGGIEAPTELARLLRENYSPYRLDKLIRQVFGAGEGEALARLWVSVANQGDFSLDAYVPAEYQSLVEGVITDAGYLPVRMSWERAGVTPLSAEVMDEKLAAFCETIGEQVITTQAAMGGSVKGFVDSLVIAAGMLVVRGWVVDESSSLPECIVVRINGRDIVFDDFERETRVDVQRHLGLDGAEVGYRIIVDAPGIDSIGQIRDFAVWVSGGQRLRLTSGVKAALSGPEVGSVDVK